MDHSAPALLAALTSARPSRTCEAPRDRRGLYGLIDHEGRLRYIGSTASRDQTLYERIHHRHRTGSETRSHYFSRMYNTGRMWRDRVLQQGDPEGDLAKHVRNAFIARHCRAVWVCLPDEADIPALEAAVIAIAPPDAIAWNRRGMAAYEEPVDLVDDTIRTLGLSLADRDSLDRQKARYLGRAIVVPAQTGTTLQACVPPFPEGPFSFCALDVETANNDRGSICQIGVAFVRPDDRIETWVTYVDPRTEKWTCSWLHGIDAATVRGAPTFAEVLPELDAVIGGLTVYQHSSFDRSAIRAARAAANLQEPNWHWLDSVTVARRAWPELKGSGGHGLASLKVHLDLDFEHHDAGEDAGAAAEIVLLAERASRAVGPVAVVPDDEIDVLERVDTMPQAASASEPPLPSRPVACAGSARPIGSVPLTQGNLNNSHFYLRELLHHFPSDVIGGSNAASAAKRTVSVDWGGQTPAATDIDGTKKLFRRRAWVSEFFRRNGAMADDVVQVEVLRPYEYRVSIMRKRC